MIKIGITGGIGSGKSIVCNVFRQLDIPVFIADTEAGFIMQKDTNIAELLIGRFGNDIYLNDGGLNKTLLSEIIFTDKEAIQYINSVVHPAVKNKFIKWSLTQNSKYCIIESAILFESGVDLHVDKVISVFAPVEKRIQRVIERDKVDKSEVLRRIANQMDEEEKAKKADYVIYNDDHQMVIPQVIYLNNLFSV